MAAAPSFCHSTAGLGQLWKNSPFHEDFPQALGARGVPQLPPAGTGGHEALKWLCYLHLVSNPPQAAPKLHTPPQARGFCSPLVQQLLLLLLPK